MRNISRWTLLLILSVFVAGCVKTTTKVMELPRVDQERGGNAGYLQGTAKPSDKPAAPRRTTRQIVVTDVELPTKAELKVKLSRKSKPVVVPTPEPVEAPKAATPAWDAVEEEIEKVQWPEASAPVSLDQPIPYERATPIPAVEVPEEVTFVPAQSYTVQKGDTLQKISQKFYGTTRKWNKIYEVNQDILKSPNKLFPGQELAIPKVSVKQRSSRTRATK